MYCPHDTPTNVEFRDDLPTLLGNNGAKLELSTLTGNIINKLKAKGPAIRIFHSSSRDDKKRKYDGEKVKFFSPYARYLAVLPFAEQERQAELVKLAAESRKRKLCPDSPAVTQNSEISFSREEDKRVALKDLEKIKADKPSSDVPPEKKRKIDTELVETIESKLFEIRKNLDKMDQPKAGNANNVNGAKSKKKNKNKKKINKQQDNTQASASDTATKSTEFDYSNVDFQKFRGGSIKEQPNVQFKSKFHGKVSSVRGIDTTENAFLLKTEFFSSFQGKNNKANKQFLKSISVHPKKK